jgi:hypothetical protein
MSPAGLKQLFFFACSMFNFLLKIRLFSLFRLFYMCCHLHWQLIRWSTFDGNKFSSEIDGVAGPVDKGWIITSSWNVMGTSADPDGWQYASALDSAMWWPSQHNTCKCALFIPYFCFTCLFCPVILCAVVSGSMLVISWFILCIIECLQRLCGGGSGIVNNGRRRKEGVEY